jgi:hypothetical protein
MYARSLRTVMLSAKVFFFLLFSLTDYDSRICAAI